MKVKKKIQKRRYCTDTMAKGLFMSLVTDFSDISKLKDYAGILATSPRAFRETKYPDYWSTSIPRFKRWYQMESLLKKYRFRDDLYSDQELTDRGWQDFLAFQTDLLTHRVIPTWAQLVLKEARRLIRAILGPFSWEEVIRKCYFGPNSSVGCTFANSYLDYKLTKYEAFTGSSDCMALLTGKVLPDDAMLSEILEKHLQQGKGYAELEPLVFVDKSWKTYRGITIMQLINLFISNGYGKLVAERLKDVRINIARGQSKHGKIIRSYSISRSHCTVDLSRASDCITIELLMRLLPREWFVALKPLLQRRVVDVDGCGHLFYTGSCLPMGNGCTFPLETLIFYCLCKAVGNLSGKPHGTYSAYGDDLIFPTRLYGPIKRVFEALGFKINAEKSFVKRNFRESCGSDYYHGVDVRPFILGPGGTRLTRSAYVAWLYKALNGLLVRWDPEEINSTLRLLFTELVALGEKIRRVPPSFPSYSGFVVPHPEFVIPGTSHHLYAPVKARFKDGTRLYCFEYYAYVPKHRAALAVFPYYWQTLQREGRTDETEQQFNFWDVQPIPGEPAKPPVQWRAIKRTRKITLKSGRVLTKKEEVYKPFVAMKDSNLLATQTTPRRRESGEGDILFVSDWI